jgi:hypothetical protein
MSEFPATRDIHVRVRRNQYSLQNFSFSSVLVAMATSRIVPALQRGGICSRALAAPASFAAVGA